ncbi:serine/threonine-protein kinase (plasmid) [Mycolicibacterium aichiense]|uniref:serine/threonine-protein kinase n=1 Tax=Mycolicibacterium aichiense TaxID=1799 RepID=UPI003D676520
MPLDPGDEFAGFTIVRILGSGGMGEVYLARHPRLPRQDALKILRPDISADPSFRERFKREADLAATLWHPNIVGVHDCGECNDQLWISMDFVDGADAGRRLGANDVESMSVNDVADILTAVASALDYAHKQGLLHRDVKPANIMLTDADKGDRRILLADFGIARAIEDHHGLTDTNFTVGTVAYSAPEQLMGERLDGRADQYALAATAYHLLVGSRLFPFSNQAVVIGRHLNAVPLLLPTHDPNWPPSIRYSPGHCPNSPMTAFPDAPISPTHLQRLLATSTQCLPRRVLARRSQPCSGWLRRHRPLRWNPPPSRLKPRLLPRRLQRLLLLPKGNHPHRRERPPAADG